MGRPKKLEKMAPLKVVELEKSAQEAPKQGAETMEAVSAAIAAAPVVSTVAEIMLPKEAPAAPIITTLTTRDILEMEDRKMVTGMFHHKKKGAMLRLGGMRKYKGEKLDPITLQDGHTYTISKWKADWLNGVSLHDEKLNPCKTPGCVNVIHNDQWTDLHNKRPLDTPMVEKQYSFTPVASW